VCVSWASVDLSHVGLKFGDERGIDDLRAQSIEAADRSMLELIRSADAEAFFNHFRPDHNLRNVDAVTAVYVLLHVLGMARGELIDYQQWREAATDSLVSFAGMSMY